MRKYIFLLLFLCPTIARSQPKWNQKYQNYIDTYKDIAIEQMLRYDIPASITLAQGLLESGAGQSELTRRGNNHFGIKCHGWTGRTTYHDDDARGECFRAYDNALQSYEDHSQFLRNGKRYASLFTLKRNDYKGWAYGLKAAGYATNPQYAQSLIGIIETYKLYQFDNERHYNKFIVGHTTSPDHIIQMCNKNYFILARRGDTFRSLAKELGISTSRLASYNERDKRDVLEEGEIVWLKKKRTRAHKSLRDQPHIVRPGESMYSIAQKYGIRLKSLYKMNDLSPAYEIKAGDKLRVY